MFPLEFRGEVKHQETKVMGMLCGEGCMILTSTVFDWSTRVTDGQTDGQTDGRWHIARYSIMLSRAKNRRRKAAPEKLTESIYGTAQGWAPPVSGACVYGHQSK